MERKIYRIKDYTKEILESIKYIDENSEISARDWFPDVRKPIISGKGKDK